MRWQYLIITTAILFACVQYTFAKGIRTLNLNDSEIAQVRVALGYSTLLQFDVRPTQAIVGDQDSFKVEYAGNAIAIKPLMSGVSTNLFIVTDYDKFNFKLTSGQGFEPDYIIRVKKKKESTQENPSGLITKVINKTVEKNGITIRLISLATTKTNTALIYSFELTATNKKLAFQPGDFEILQKGKTLPIENIYLERLALPKGQKAYGMILIRKEELGKSKPTILRITLDTLKNGIQVQAPPM